MSSDKQKLEGLASLEMLKQVLPAEDQRESTTQGMKRTGNSNDTPSSTSRPDTASSEDKRTLCDASFLCL